MKTQTSHGGPPVSTRLVAWLNIAVQAALPLTLAMATPGATASPPKPTSSLQSLPELGSPGQEATAQAEDEQARKLAAMASDTGNFLSSNPDSDAAASMARGLATSEASGQAQTWLSRFGTARVQVDVDDKLSLKNSQVELLVPLHDTPEQLLFTQGSIHRKDERQQTSLGLGVRRFNDSYMLGANSFLDHDLSRGHSRLGLGVEYWRDFLKVNANSYQRLTGWKDSPDVEDYQERPANGWDLRTEAWLPAMPQLGGKLTYEQYYGDEVGLFGKDNRKKDPSAVTVGLTYTPIPLLTFSAEQRKGNGADETTFGAEFNYRLGEAWARQVDPAGVGALRTLAGSRYDLVERNNHIVLEYRKKQVIQMAAAAHITGQAGETKSLSVWVNSKHPLSHIDWTSPALLQAGGKLVHDGGPHYSVVLPDYQTGAQHTNLYTLHGVAVDSRGNRSARSETRVTVNAPALSIGHSTFTPVDNLLPADGKSQATLTLAVRDEQKQPLDIALEDIQIAVKQTRAAGLVVSDPTRVSVGVYEVLVTAGTSEQSVTLTPSIKGTVLSQARVTATNTIPSPGKSTFSISPALIKADDKETATLTFTAKDENDLPLEGIADKLKFVAVGSKGAVSPPNVTIGTITESAKGSYSATLKGTLADTYTVTPLFETEEMKTLSKTVVLTPLPLDEKNSHISTSQKEALADDVDQIRIDFSARNILNQPISGIAKDISFVLTDGTGNPAANIKLGEITESGTGTYTTTLTGATAGTYHVAAQVNGVGWGSLNTSFKLLTTEIVTLNRTLATPYPYEFPVSSKFPTTAYEEAQFGIKMANDAVPDTYNWSANVDWLVYKGAGIFEFVKAPSSDVGNITITGTRKGSSVSHSYSFKIASWYYLSPSGEIFDWNEAMNRCDALKLSRVTRTDATRGENVNAVGSLASEWGRIISDSSGTPMWLSETNMMLESGLKGTTGVVRPALPLEAGRTICRKALK